MKNRNFTVWIISDDDEFKRSFRISQIFFNVGLFFVIGVIGFSIFGLLRVTGADDLTNEVRELRRFQNFAVHIIEDIGGENLVKKFPKIEEALKNQFSDLESLMPFGMPVEGYVTQGLELEQAGYEHYGIDIAAKARELIKSPASGLVVYSGDMGELGNTIILAHAKGFFTVYGHNDENLVKIRQNVTRGDAIARVGQSGLSDGPHLHFEIWKNSEVLDPREFIAIYKEKDISINETR